MKRARFTTDSRKVKKGDVFIALKGSLSDGHEHVQEALEKGARYAFVEKKVWKKLSDKRKESFSKIKKVHSTRKEYSRLSAEYYNWPSKKLVNIGITGTNGKTTVAFLIDKMLKDADIKTGLIGTICYKVGKKLKNAGRTTPEAFELNRILNEMVKEKVSHSIMEVSSHALEQERAGDVFYDLAIFTNLTPEHLDYHKDMDTYFNAKKKIFDNLKGTGMAIVNLDDDKGMSLKRSLKTRGITFSLRKKADVTAKKIKMTMSGSSFEMNIFEKTYRVKTALIGEHNISNILATVCAGVFLGIKDKDILKSISKAKAPAGRLQSVNGKSRIKVFVDYAHTADALQSVLMTLSKIKEKDIITVFGCGGDRDRSKRPMMGRAVCKYSDKVIVTSDNPRTEDPNDIIKDILKGIQRYKDKYIVQKDRKKAIKKALQLARKNSIVLIAGKGHEKYQLIGDKKVKFDDVKVVQEMIGTKSKKVKVKSLPA